MRRVSVVVGMVMLASVVGCRPPEAEPKATPTYSRMIDRLEAVRVELDRPAPDLRAVRAELDRLTLDLQQAAVTDARRSRELTELRGKLDSVQSATRLTDLELLFFSRLLDDDNNGMVDHMLLALAPRAGPDTVKAPGTMTVELCLRTLFPGGAGKVLQTWTFAEDDLPAYWHGDDVFDRYEFRLELARAVLENLKRKPFVVRVRFRPVGGQEIVKTMTMDEKMLK